MITSPAIRANLCAPSGTTPPGRDTSRGAVVISAFMAECVRLKEIQQLAQAGTPSKSCVREGPSDRSH